MANHCLQKRGQDCFPVLWRSLLYTAVVLVMTFAEHLFHAWGTQGSLDGALVPPLASRDLHHFLALNLCVALSFLLYNSYAKLDRRLGRGSIRRVLFSRARDAEARDSPAPFGQPLSPEA